MKGPKYYVVLTWPALFYFSAKSWSLIQRSPTECGVSEWDHEAATMMKPWPTWGSRVMKN